MGISRRFLNLIKDSSYHGTKGLVFNSATATSRKLSTVGSGSESFLNLIVDTGYPGKTSLRPVDLRDQLFNTSTPPSTFGEVPESAAVQYISSYYADYLKKKQAQVAELKMDWFQPPPPIFSFQATGVPSGVDFFPLTDRKVLINHHSGGTMLFDVDTYHTATMPKLHWPHGTPTISLFVPSADPDDHLAGGGSLYIMQRIHWPKLSSSAVSDKFVALVYGRPTMTSPCRSADCRLLPPPSSMCDRAYDYPYPKITAYAGVGSDIYISAERAGTHCLDTLSNTWHRVGQWTLPFRGQVEYVPELKLWLGLSAEHGHLAAADLSDMNSQPQLVDTDNWKELELPNEWLPSRDSRLINLGSGRFCIARFFCELLMDGDSVDEINRILVLTGVEVTSPVHDGNRSGSCTSEVKLAIRQHKSKCHISESTSIRAVF